jgi:hypothetical protein
MDSKPYASARSAGPLHWKSVRRGRLMARTYPKVPGEDCADLSQTAMGELDGPLRRSNMSAQERSYFMM